jgi:8-oxo-dGTP pyrophosphatase MutT (NUDIX family)
VSTAEPERIPYAAKLVSGAALLRDDRGRILIVNPTYKPGWEMPGGIAEEDEPPSVACRRELLEELGLDREVGRLLSVEWRPPRVPFGDGLHFIFDGGLLTPPDLEAIRLPAEELSEWGLFGTDEARERLPERLWHRVAAALSVVDSNEAPVYLEAGTRIG